MERERDEVTAEPSSSKPRIDRRAAIGMGAAAGAAAWVAPAILSTEAAAAATAAPAACDCGPTSSPIFLFIVFGPCLSSATTVTVTGSVSGVQTQSPGSTPFGTPVILTFNNLCDGETVTISLSPDPSCSTGSPLTYTASCSDPTPSVVFTCPCGPPP